MNVTRVKDGALFEKIAPAGFRILSAIDQTAAELRLDLTITSGSDGEHSGPTDPHHSGEAYDVRSQDMTEDVKQKVITSIMDKLGFEQFYGFLEAAGTPTEHFHIQRKRGTTYP